MSSFEEPIEMKHRVSLPICCAADVTRSRDNFQGFEICQLCWKLHSSDPKKFASLLMLGRLMALHT